MLKDKQFYNQESETYSFKRYPEIASSYIQFFFKQRLALVLKELIEETQDRDQLALLEIGCADGIVLRQVDGLMGDKFSEIIGIDNAEQMIEKAQELSRPDKIKYLLRDKENPNNKYDIILEIGVANYADIDEELSYAFDKLKSEGRYLLSLAGRNSFVNLFGKSDGYNNFLSYQEYEKKIRKNFEIIKIVPVGFYLPFLWKSPALGKIIQPFLEWAFRFIMPNLFHEKICIICKKK